MATRVVDILRNRDFRLLWSGQFVSLLGDQFFLVALPWLVLQLTGNAFSVGAVVAVNAAPRAVFILLGGVLIDRWSPRTVMLYSNLARMVVVAVLAILTATGFVRLWMLYPFAFLLGLGYALFLPALSAVIPRLVPEDRLQAGNAIIQGTSQLSLFVGPVLAGIMITFLGAKGAGADAVPEASGLGLGSGWTRWDSWSRPSRSRCSRCRGGVRRTAGARRAAGCSGRWGRASRSSGGIRLCVTTSCSSGR